MQSLWLSAFWGVTSCRHPAQVANLSSCWYAAAPGNPRHPWHWRARMIPGGRRGGQVLTMERAPVRYEALVFRTSRYPPPAPRCRRVVTVVRRGPGRNSSVVAVAVALVADEYLALEVTAVRHVAVVGRAYR